MSFITFALSIDHLVSGNTFASEAIVENVFTFREG